MEGAMHDDACLPYSQVYLLQSRLMQPPSFNTALEMHLRGMP